MRKEKQTNEEASHFIGSYIVGSFVIVNWMMALGNTL